MDDATYLNQSPKLLLMPHKSKKPQDLKKSHEELHENEPDDYPLQPRAVDVVLMVSEHVQHLLQQE